MTGQIVPTLDYRAPYLLLAENPLNPDQAVKIAKVEVFKRKRSDFSIMPAGLLNNLSKQEVLDLLAYLIKRLSEMKEGEGSVLDNTCLFYGSSNSKTHNNNNYPLVLAGGKDMGFEHGQFLKFGSEVPLSNLFVTIQKSLGVKADSFADSNGEMKEVVA